MRESDPRFANLERRVGLFLAASLLIVLAAAALVGARHGLFTPQSALVFIAESGDGLDAGMDVVTRGFRIGQVKSVRLDDAGRVEVRLEIRTSLMRWVRSDSVARLAPKALIGDSRIEISPGSPGAPPATSGQAIAFVHEPDLADIAKKLMEEDVKPVLDGVRNLVAYLDDPRGDVKQAIAGANRLSSGLNETQAQLGRRLDALAADLQGLATALRVETLPKVHGLLGQGEKVLGDADRTVLAVDALVREDLRAVIARIDGEILPQLRGVVANADRAATAAGDGAEAAARELPALLAKLDATLENVRVITERLVPASEQVPGVVREGGALVEDAQDLVKSIQGTWPFRPDAKPRGTTIDVDSHPIKKTPQPAAPAAGPGPR